MRALLSRSHPLAWGLAAVLCLAQPAAAQTSGEPAQEPQTSPTPPAEPAAAATPATPITPPATPETPAVPQTAGAPPPAPPQPGQPQPTAGGGMTVPPSPGSPPAGPLSAPTPGVPPPPGAPAPLASEKLDFDLNFPPSEGKPGGSARGSAGSLEYQRDDYAVLSGGVRIRYQDIDLAADRAELDLNTKVVVATGHVVLDQGPRRLTGETLTFDLDTKTGTVDQATAHVNPDYYFQGKQIAKIGDNTYTVTAGSFTSCSQQVPDWSFRLGTAQVENEGYAHIHNATMRVKNVPVFYTPYILWPAKSERASGLLVPNVGYSDTRGGELSLAYFQTLGRSFDTTFHVDTFTENYLGLGDELRFRPSEGTRGAFVGYIVQDPVLDEWRWKLELNTITSDLPFGMRGAIAYQDFSDFNFFKDFERDFDRNTQRSIDSRAFATGNWGPHLLNILVQDRDTFISVDQSESVVQRRLPEIEYRLRSTRIGRTPFYLQGQSSADYFDLDRPGAYAGRYPRFDLFPQIMLPLSPLPWISFTVGGGERLTWYGDTLDAKGLAFTGETRLRALPSASAEVVGPSFSRIYSGDWGKLRHLIQPRLTYTYLGNVDDPQEIPLFDEIDTTRAINFARAALSNRFLAKPAAAAGGKSGSAREILLIEIARAYSFDDLQPLQVSVDRHTTSQSGPFEGLVRYNPTPRTSAQATVLYDTLFGGISSTALSGNLGFGTNAFGLTWFTRSQPETGQTLSDQIRLSGAFDVLPRKIRLEGQWNYDIEQGLLQQQRIVATYTGQCYGLRLELRDFRAGIGPRTRDKDIRLSLSLKNVGTFLDLTGRSSTTQEP